MLLIVVGWKVLQEKAVQSYFIDNMFSWHRSKADKMDLFYKPEW